MSHSWRRRTISRDHQAADRRDRRSPAGAFGQRPDRGQRQHEQRAREIADEGECVDLPVQVREQNDPDHELAQQPRFQ